MLQPIEIQIYTKENGSQPFIEWRDSIKDAVMRTRIISRIHRLQIGQFGDYKSLGQGIGELRMHFGKGYRIYFGRIGNTIVLLLSGGDKDTQQKDITKAREYWQEYKEGMSCDK